MDTYIDVKQTTQLTIDKQSYFKNFISENGFTFPDIIKEQEHNIMDNQGNIIHIDMY